MTSRLTARRTPCARASHPAAACFACSARLFASSAAAPASKPAPGGKRRVSLHGIRHDVAVLDTRIALHGCHPAVALQADQQ